MKKKMKKKTWLFAAAVLILAFVVFNAFWFAWRTIRYENYAKNMETFRPHVSYVLTSEDGYLYNVKFPDYLSFTGNLCVATPDGETALILWPNVFKGYRYGLQIEDEGETISIELDENLDARDQSFRDMVDQNKAAVLLLKEKAETMWE